MCVVRNSSLKGSHRVNFSLKFLFHLSGVIYYFALCAGGLLIMLALYDKHMEDVNIHTFATYPECYLTNWNFTFQTFFFSLSFYHDILEWMDKHNSNFGKRLRYYRDLLFSSMVFPYTLFVTAMFWSVYSVDRELVFPKVFDEIVPWWFNHCVHTNITIMVIIEIVLQPRRSPVNRKIELFLVGGVAVIYSFIYYTIYFSTHRWLYPVFGVMTWWQIVLFQLLIFASCVFFYFIQYPISRIIHGPEPEEEKEIKENGIESGDDIDYDRRGKSLKQRIEEDNSKL